MSNNEINLKIIQEPAPNTRIILMIDPPEIIFFIGDGRTNFLCGKCHTILADGIEEGNLKSMVLKCNKCQSFNEIPELKKPGKRYAR